MRLLLIIIFVTTGLGCSTLRTTDPERTATEQYLLNEASRRSINQLLAGSLRDRLVYVDTTYLIGTRNAELEYLFVAGELRSKLLQGGARLTDDKNAAQVVLEVRAVAVGIDRLETLFGIPAIALPSQSQTAVPLLTPELAIVKRLRQYGYSSIAFVAYWHDTGELAASSGPFLGKTDREDFWILGLGPRTVGTIPPAKD